VRSQSLRPMEGGFCDQKGIDKSGILLLWGKVPNGEILTGQVKEVADPVGEGSTKVSQHPSFAENPSH